MKKGRILLGLAALLLLILIGTAYKAFGPLGNAFLATILILVVIYTLVGVFQGLEAKAREKKKKK